jgi:hypothetical protein
LHNNFGINRWLSAVQAVDDTLYVTDFVFAVLMLCELAQLAQEKEEAATSRKRWGRHKKPFPKKTASGRSRSRSQ